MYLSLALPVLNDIKNVKLLVNNLLKQTDQNFEIVIVDGGSTDGTWEYLKSIQSKFKRMVLLREEGTIRSTGNARNQAVDASSGDFILNFDSDFDFSSNLIEVLNEVIKSNSNLDLIKVCFNHDFSVIKNSFSFRNLSFIRDNLHNTAVLLLINRKVFPKFCAECSYGEDRLFLDDLYSQNPSFIVVHRKIFLYPRGLPNLSEFIKRFRWYGRTSVNYFFKTKSFSEKFFIVIGWLALPIFPIGFLFGLLKGFHRLLFVLDKRIFSSPIYVVGIIFLEILSMYLFSFGFIEYLLGNRVLSKI